MYFIVKKKTTTSQVKVLYLTADMTAADTISRAVICRLYDILISQYTYLRNLLVLELSNDNLN